MSTEIQKADTTQQVTLKGYFEKSDVKQRFNEMLGKKAQGFITSVLQVAAGNDKLRSADPMSIYNAACTAATMDLPINNNLGFAYMVPYKLKFQDAEGRWRDKNVAQFQIGYKGLVQLAQRTGQYQKMNVIEVYASQFVSFNELTEELVIELEKEPAGGIHGYCAYFKMLNGFEKTVYWKYAKVEAHAYKFSKSIKDGKFTSVWKEDFDGMAKKTVLKHTISKWGMLSIEMQTALKTDQAVLKDDMNNIEDYPDNPANDPIDKVRERFELLIANATSVEELSAYQADISGQDEGLHDLIELAEKKKAEFAN